MAKYSSTSKNLIMAVVKWLYLLLAADKERNNSYHLALAAHTIQVCHCTKHVQVPLSHCFLQAHSKCKSNQARAEVHFLDFHIQSFISLQSITML